ncbi:MAG: ABC transporter substrate-binding protein [Cyanobacteria bacterium P01_A01_bin.137]
MAPKGGENLRDTSQDLFSVKVFLTAAGVLGLAFLGLTWLSRGELDLSDSSPQIEEVQLEQAEPEPEPPSQLSQGEKILLPTATMALKTDGADALASGDYAAAVTAFENARTADISDPETLIYLNNARIGDDEAYGLGVIAPLATDIGQATNLLRGIAQAQTEINQAGGIQGKPLRVLLADDRGDVAIAQQIATELSQAPDVFAAVGHSDSSTAAAAADIYGGSLPFVSTSATSNQPLLANDLPIANALAFYMAKLNHRTAILFYDGNSDYSLGFKASFEEALTVNNGTMTAEVNLADLPNSAPTKTPEAEIFVLSPGASPLQTAKDSIDIIPNDKVDHLYRHVFGGYELFSPDVLDLFGSMATGTILAVPEKIYQSEASPFSDAPRALWETTVDWTTSASYNTAQSIITGLKESPTRQGIQEAIDRDTDDTVHLLRVNINPNAATGYDLLSIGVMTKDGFKPD